MTLSQYCMYVRYIHISFAFLQLIKVSASAVKILQRISPLDEILLRNWTQELDILQWDNASKSFTEGTESRNISKQVLASMTLVDPTYYDTKVGIRNYHAS